jgi:general secretion pathway protein C
MNPLQLRLLSFAAFAVFCATATWWGINLATHRPVTVDAAAAHVPLSVDEAGTLFGGKPAQKSAENIQLSGILALAQGAAAIISVDGGPPKAVSLGGPVGENGKLAEVRARSIVIDRHGAHAEIFLPAAGSGPTIYVR